VLAALVMSSFACASNKGRVASTLSGAVAAFEITESGERLAIPAEGITEVDVNSSIVLQMNEAAIKEAAPPPAGLRARAEALTKDLAQVTAVLRAQHAALDQLRKYEADPAKTREKQKAANAPRLEAAKQARALALSRGDAPHDLYTQTGFDQVLGYLRALKQEHEALLGDSENRVWRMRASLGASARGEPIHLPNYDVLSAGAIDIKNKLIPVVDDKVRQEFEQAKAAAKAAKDLDGLIRVLEKDAEKRIDDLVGALDQILGSLKQRVEPLPELRSKSQQAAAALAKVKATVDAAQLAFASCGKLLEHARTADRSRPVTFASSLAPGAKDCIKELKTLGVSASDAHAEAVKLANVAGLEELGRKIQEEVKSVVTESLTLDKVSAVVGLGDLASSVPAPVWAREADFRDQALGGLTDTRIDLIATPRETGDYVSYQGLVRDRSADSVLVEGPLRTLRVVTTGAQIKMSGTLLFVQPTRRASNEDPFRAAPAITGSLHYYWGRGAGETEPTGGAWLWNRLDPGIGVHASTLTLGKLRTDPTTGQNVAEAVETPHIGIAGVAQLFGDIAQAGGGYDFQAGRAYWFVGVGIQTLTKLGVDFEL
jgi:hypothetical protein